MEQGTGRCAIGMVEQGKALLEACEVWLSSGSYWRAQLDVEGALADREMTKDILDKSPSTEGTYKLVN